MSRTAGSGRDLTLPPLALVVCPDDYLLERARIQRESAWQEAHPQGELVTFSEAPLAATLLAELSTPSLFAAERLLVVREAAAYLFGNEQARLEGEALARGLERFSFPGVWLLLTATGSMAPAGPLAEVAARRGEVVFLELPPPPKPWEEGVVLSASQRRLLEEIVLESAPQLRGKDEVIEALCEMHGFKPRQLSQTARQLVQLEEVTVAAVHQLAGPGERSISELEDMLIAGDGHRATQFFAVLVRGGALVSWRGDAVGERGLGRVLGGATARLLRQALAVRGHAQRAGLSRELDPRLCAQERWYNATFRARLLAPLQQEIAAHPASPVAGLSPWVLHRLFRLAARYDENALLRGLVALERSEAELAEGQQALAAVAAVVLELLATGGGAGARRARAG
ncbi:MAG: hypothetical protein HXY19_08895 [Thermoanaerobaculaceae bacterium]|jgi:hypothetical protein|nr:hypothetical protein [Thermoanaerobaculaceae bacterium]